MARLPLDKPSFINGITSYDEAHFPVYLALLDAKAAGVDWRQAARQILRLDPTSEPGLVKEIWQANLSRAEWMTRQGYKYLLKDEP